MMDVEFVALRSAKQLMWFKCYGFTRHPLRCHASLHHHSVTALRNTSLDCHKRIMIYEPG